MKDMYITIAGLQYKYGTGFLEKGLIIDLVKEPDNKIDKEAIKIELTPFGTIGYVANSVRTVIGECYSAGRIYDKIGHEAKAEVCFITPIGIIAKILPDETTSKKKGKKDKD